MRFEAHPLVAPSSVAAGDALLVERFTEKAVIVGGTFTATCRVQASLDGTNWADVSGDVAAPAIVEVPATVKYLRINTTAFTGGAIEASFGGLDARAI